MEAQYKARYDPTIRSGLSFASEMRHCPRPHCYATIFMGRDPDDESYVRTAELSLRFFERSIWHCRHISTLNVSSGFRRPVQPLRSASSHGTVARVSFDLQGNG